MKLNIRVGGAAGQGMQTIGQVLSKTFARGGLEVFAVMDYQSRIRGGHNYFQIRVADNNINAKSDAVDILVSLDEATIELDRGDVREGGIIINDGEACALVDGEGGVRCLSIPFAKLALDAAGDKLYSNSVAVGAVLGFIGYDMDILYKVLEDFFSHKKGSEVAENNIKASKAGLVLAKELNVDLGVDKIEYRNTIKMLINGNDAIALGALAAGCKFFSSYPMTPSTSIFVAAAKYSHDFGAIVEQAEDEIAAMNMIIGAAYAGTRSMTTTSGGGFCLMVEALGFSAIAEIPVVIVNSQRSGPSTGLPTRTEQGDLLFAINASHGDFVHAVLAPSSPLDAFHLTVKAFEIADKYQIPVVILDDQFLADTLVTVDAFDVSSIKPNRCIMSNDELAALEIYNRYEVTDSGVSPRALPGQSEHVVVSDSDEHTKDGHLTEDLQAAMEQKKKRARKLEQLSCDIELPKLYGHPEAKHTLITWGSTFGVAKELLEQKSCCGNFNIINITEVWPLNGEFFTENLRGKKGITVEGNSTGQMARLIRQVSGVEVDSILRYDGRPFSIEYLEEKLKERGICHD